MILPIGQLMMAEVAGPKRMGRVMSIVAVPAMLAPILGPTHRRPHPRQRELALDLLRQRPDRHHRGRSWRCGSCPASRRRRRPARRPRPRADGDRAAAAHLRPGRDRRDRQLHGDEGRRAAAWPASRSSRPSWCTRCACRARCSTCASTGGPTFASASFTMFCLGGALFGSMILLPLYWQEIRGESVVHTGLLTAPQGLGMALVMPLAGKLSRPLGRRSAGARRRGGDDARDDPVRADRRAHLDPRSVASRCSCAGWGSGSPSCPPWRPRSRR